MIGLWKEEDIYTLSLESLKKPPAFLERKVLTGEKVSVLTPDLSSGLSMLACLFFKLKSVLLPNFSIALSLYPSKTDVSVGPGETVPDFTLESGEIRFYAVDNEKANSEGIISQIQKEGIEEHKDILDFNNIPGNGYSNARNEGREKNKIKQGTKIIIYAFIFSLLLMVKFLLLIVEFFHLTVGLLLLSKIGLYFVFP